MANQTSAFLLVLCFTIFGYTYAENNLSAAASPSITIQATHDSCKSPHLANTPQSRADFSITPTFATSYAEQNIAQWTADDFKAWATDEKLTPTQLFARVDLYKHHSFMQLLQTYPDYKERMVALHLIIKKHYANWFAKLGGIISNTYSRGLEIQIKAIVVALQKDELINQQLKNQQALAKVAHYQRLRTIIIKNSSRDKEYLAECKTEWHNSASEQHQRRALAAQKMIDHGNTFLIKQYTHTGELFGNEMQHALQDELESIAEYCQKNKITMYHEGIQNILPEAVALGIQANKAGFIAKTIAITDLCFAIIDGVAQGIENFVDTITHPIEFVKNTMNGLTSIANCTAQLAGVVSKLGYLYATGDENFYRQTEQINDYVQTILEATQTYLAQTPAHQLVANTTAFITENLLFFGCTKLAANCCKKLTTQLPKILQYTKSFVHESEYAIAGMPDIKVPGIELMKANKNIIAIAKEELIDAPSNQWTNYRHKHAVSSAVPWKKVVKSTSHGHAKYKPSMNIKSLEKTAWEKGITVNRDNRNWKIMKYDYVIGAKSGQETACIKVKMSGNTLHGHPITLDEYNKLIK
jgi:hypothetical protein